MTTGVLLLVHSGLASRPTTATEEDVAMHAEVSARQRAAQVRDVFCVIEKGKGTMKEKSLLYYTRTEPMFTQ